MGSGASLELDRPQLNLDTVGSANTPFLFGIAPTPLSWSFFLKLPTLLKALGEALLLYVENVIILIFKKRYMGSCGL